MARSDAFQKNYSVYINAALIAAHANFLEKGFRQKDVKFYIELLTNWMETSFSGPGLEIKNTQSQRLLEQLTEENILSKKEESGKPVYNFTSVGLLEIITRLVDVDKLDNLETFYFLHHFVSFYSEKMEQLLMGEKHSLPKSYQLEIKHLLNPNNLVERQIQEITFKRNRLKERIHDGKRISEISKKLKERNAPLSEIIKTVEAEYPYQLNNQKKMTDLFKTLTPDMQLLEITDAPGLRAKTLWEPLLLHYESYLESLKELQEVTL